MLSLGLNVPNSRALFQKSLVHALLVRDPPFAVTVSFIRHRATIPGSDGAGKMHVPWVYRA